MITNVDHPEGARALRVMTCLYILLGLLAGLCLTLEYLFPGFLASLIIVLHWIGSVLQSVFVEVMT